MVKKKICFYVLMLFIYCNIVAQNANKKGVVTYNHIFYRDTLFSLGTETESFLFFDADARQSIYVWNRKSKSRTEELMTLSDGTGFLKVKNGGSDAIGQVVFKDYKSDNIVERMLGKPKKIVSDSFKINWEIGTETKTIKDMVLQKAECDFRGRHYIAWFNPQIPVPDGPWKLRGLPGIIIEAYDEQKHVQFNFVSLVLPAQFTEKIEAPTDGTPLVYDCIKFTTAHYERVRELAKAMTGKVKQAGGEMQGGNDDIKTNIMERCY